MNLMPPVDEEEALLYQVKWAPRSLSFKTKGAGSIQASFISIPKLVSWGGDATGQSSVRLQLVALWNRVFKRVSEAMQDLPFLLFLILTGPL